MFSSRLRWNLNPNPLATLLEQKRAAGTQVLDLTESNPTRAGLDYADDEILRAVATREALVYRPSPAGMREAREAISHYYGRGVSPDRILLTASTSEAYSYLFKLLADPGDEVLIPRPSYPLFDYLAELESVKAAAYPLVYDHGWFIDFGALESLIHARTRAIVIVNPNNPTGSYIKRAELERLGRLCRDHELAIISDEVFSEFALAPDANAVRTLVEFEGALSFSLSGLSKVAALPQMKLGWIVVSGPEELRRGAYERLELIADTYLSAGTPVQCGAAALLATRTSIQEQIRRRTAANLELLNRVVRSTGFGALRVEGGWYAILQVPRVRSEEEWAVELLRRENVLTQPGYFYDFGREAYLVLSLLTPSEVFGEGLKRILAFG